MPLQLPEGSRFPRRGEESESLPISVVAEFDTMVGQIAAQGERQRLLEHFKGYFCGVVGAAHSWSSNEGWAATDLSRFMREAADNPALFLEALYDGCETLRATGEYELPSVDMLNDILREHGVGFEIRPPRLVRLTEPVVRVPHPEPPPTLAEDAAAIVRASMQRAEDLLAQNRPREAVQEMLWMLESIATTFRGVTLPTGTIQGRYFNEIARELRSAGRGTTLERVVEWCNSLHGYLSSPTGGGVRHGLDLNSGSPLSPEEGRLFCNLILSYVTFLMAEHAKLS
ncbi:MAG TPA: hypothetical protein VGA18_01730 [Rhodothermales bacterium]